ncbi:GNAT family N-acetyltransferase [Streptomyces sp. NPDC006733]|uniref:GNAT family N-acetyltransferase n=1 Tax=Streptomyces sp. NPDC006733 TaxID=3155460 RepID=UPI0033FE80FF
MAEDTLTGDTVRLRRLEEADWDDVVALEARAYAESGLSEGREVLRSRGRVSPATCFVLEHAGQFGGYLLALPYPSGRCPDLTLTETSGYASANLHAHDFVITEALRARGLTPLFVRQIEQEARAQGYDRISMVAVQRSHVLWRRLGWVAQAEVGLPESYGTEAVYMSKAL